MSETATATLTTLPRIPSRGSLSSLVSFSCTAEKRNSHHLVTAPCTRCGHVEPIKSLLSVVEKSLLRCPHCHAHPALLENRPGENTAEDVLESLHRALADVELTLRRHGAELERFSQMYPSSSSPESREPSLRSVATVAGNVDEKRVSGHHHPLVHDAEDLKQFTSGVTRLMRTLHVQVSRLEREEKALRAERSEVAKEREEIARLKEALQEELKEEGTVTRGRKERSIDFSDDLRLDATMSFDTVDYCPSPERVWTEEKERELARLEEQLLRANKNWSPEQEDVLPMVERLREERRKAKKRLSRQGSLKVSTPEPAAPLPAKKRSSFSTFSMGRRDSKELKAGPRRGSAGDAGAGGGVRLLRFFSGRKER